MRPCGPQRRREHEKETGGSRSAARPRAGPAAGPALPENLAPWRRSRNSPTAGICLPIGGGTALNGIAGVFRSSRLTGRALRRNAGNAAELPAPWCAGSGRQHHGKAGCDGERCAWHCPVKARVRSLRRTAALLPSPMPGAPCRAPAENSPAPRRRRPRGGHPQPHPAQHSRRVLPAAGPLPEGPAHLPALNAERRFR